MKLRELFEQLTFHGRPCTKDCSGHKAGWEWERKNQTNRIAQTPSTSFNNGTEIAVSQRQAGKQPIGTNIRGEKGRFQKFQKVKEDTLNELFDKPVDWHWDEKENGFLSASFMIGQARYVVLLTNEPIYHNDTGEYVDDNVWDVEFQDPTANNPHGITGKGNATTVFATVISILTKFKYDNLQATLKFTAKEPSRQKLYNRLIGTLQQMGLKVHQAQSPNGEMGYLVR